MIWLLLLACTGSVQETGSDDSGLDDSGALDTDDTGTPDDTDDAPLEGWGDLSGDCGPLDADELTASDPFLFVNHLDLPGEPTQGDLTGDGAEVLTDGNLGGSSIWSEVLAMEVLHRCEGAALLQTEAEIVYDDPSGKKSDLRVHLDGHDVGVSVTRAFRYPPGTPFEVADATALLEDKLTDVKSSSDNVADTHAWTKQVLHVLAWDADAAASVEAAWPTLDASVRGDTVVYVTVTDGDDDFVY